MAQPKKFTDDQIRQAMAAEGTIQQKAATIGIHHGGLADRARKLGLLGPPVPRPGHERKTTATAEGARRVCRKAAAAKFQSASPQQTSTEREPDTLRQSPSPRHLEAWPREPYATHDEEEAALAAIVAAQELVLLSSSPTKSDVELFRMTGVLRGIAALSPASRAWVLEAIRTDLEALGP